MTAPGFALQDPATRHDRREAAETVTTAGNALGPPIDERCGTTAGWNVHQRRGVPQCGPCRAAWAAYKRARRRNLGESTSVLVPVVLVRRAIAETSPGVSAELAALLRSGAA